MKRGTSARVSAVLAAAAALAVMLAGCASGEGQEAATESAVPEATAPLVGGDEESGSSGAPSVAATPAGDQGLQEAAAGYLNVRENQASHFHAKPGDWFVQAQPFMTPEGYAALTAGIEDVGNLQGGYAWEVSHEQGLAVRVQVGECVLVPGGAHTESEKDVSCPVTDVVVDRAGNPVPSMSIPATWPYVGDQPDAVLSMKVVDGGWKVDADQTGMSG